MVVKQLNNSSILGLREEVKSSVLFSRELYKVLKLYQMIFLISMNTISCSCTSCVANMHLPDLTEACESFLSPKKRSGKTMFDRLGTVRPSTMTTMKSQEDLVIKETCHQLKELGELHYHCKIIRVNHFKHYLFLSKYDKNFLLKTQLFYIYVSLC